MEKLRLYRFKAFKEEIIIPFDNKNLLLYGENGAGKSSFYESFKFIFFKDKLIEHISAPTPEDKQQKIQDFKSQYNNQIDNNNFEIEINDVHYDTFNTSNHQVFMISLENLKIDNNNSIYLTDLIKKNYLQINDVDKICEDFFSLVEEEVNSKLLSFNESVTIEIDKEDNYSIKFVDTLKNIKSKNEIKIYFNEAKINAILLLIILSFIRLTEEEGKKKILILDDFITSLDSSNRIFLIKYILENFDEAQIVIFTHNISFYNLIIYIINMKSNSSSKWIMANLYEINNIHKVFFRCDNEDVATLKSSFQQIGQIGSNVDIVEIGNKIRKKFEILLYEFSKLLMIGAVEDSKKIIERIDHSKSLYYNQGKTASDLVDVLESILNENNPNNLSIRLQNCINSYKSLEFANFKKIIKELKLYQKVTMHPMSHGSLGLPTFTNNEIVKSLDLLERMESYIMNLANTNVSVV